MCRTWGISSDADVMNTSRGNTGRTDKQTCQINGDLAWHSVECCAYHCQRPAAPFNSINLIPKSYTHSRVNTISQNVTVSQGKNCPPSNQWCGPRPSVSRQDRSEIEKSVLVLVLQVWHCVVKDACHARRHNNLEGHSNFLSTIYSLYSVLGTSLLWRSTVGFTYLKVKSAKCLCLLPLVLVLSFWSWSWSCNQRSNLGLGLVTLVLFLRIWSCLHHWSYHGRRWGLKSWDAKA